MVRRRRIKKEERAISDIVAVVMLILIAISASVLIYMWMSGLVGSVHKSNPGLYEKIQIVSASISGSGSSYIINASVQNLGSSTVQINSLSVINASNGNAIYSNSSSNISTSIPSGKVVPVTSGNVSISDAPPVGTPVIIEVTTTHGVQATYQTTWP
ncbi:MAG: hypothetical protein F7B61_00405 [Caldisphaeraceae archaeon]|nr:hypothetical protein [Caldisphaeraceae archaeon]